MLFRVVGAAKTERTLTTTRQSPHLSARNNFVITTGHPRGAGMSLLSPCTFTSLNKQHGLLFGSITVHNLYDCISVLSLLSQSFRAPSYPPSEPRQKAQEPAPSLPKSCATSHALRLLFRASQQFITHVPLDCSSSLAQHDPWMIANITKEKPSTRGLRCD